jgi:hypothetical protein
MDDLLLSLPSISPVIEHIWCFTTSAKYASPQKGLHRYLSHLNFPLIHIRRVFIAASLEINSVLWRNDGHPGTYKEHRWRYGMGKGEAKHQ